MKSSVSARSLVAASDWPDHTAPIQYKQSFYPAQRSERSGRNRRNDAENARWQQSQRKLYITDATQQ